MGLVGKRVRVVAPGSGYDGFLGTVTDEWDEPEGPDGLVVKLDGLTSDLAIGSELVEVVEQ
jgi:hypothetical protein